MYKVILYYNFAKINDPEKFCRDHHQLCESLDLMGRIYIAQEGINGTVAGISESIEQYKKALRHEAGFETTEFKEDICQFMPFRKLIVKTRPEIVTLKASVPLDITKERGKYAQPAEWKKLLESGGDFNIIDVRNHYESSVGYFEGAIRPNIENFYEFEKWLDEEEFDKNKKMLIYCTGGIRCEKFSVLMEKKGFQDVVQLHGGIIEYAKQVGGAHYKGKCFVFDDRLTVPVEENQKEPVGRCLITGVPSDTFINCANMDCNQLFICSAEGARQMEGFCGEECRRNASRRRPIDPEDIYAPSRKWYQYYGAKNKHGFVMPNSAKERIS
jgi:UPF0176 protein